MKLYLKFSYAVLLASINIVSYGQTQVAITQVHSIKPEKFLPAQNKIVSVTFGDVDNNGIEDAIIVSENPNKTNSMRLLQIVRSFHSGKVKLSQNKLLIPCSACGGRSEEPTLREVKVLKNGFEVQIYWGGINNAFMKSVQFNYEASKRNWYVKKQVVTRFDDNHQTESNYAVTKTRRFSKYSVSFERASQHH